MWVTSGQTYYKLWTPLYSGYSAVATGYGPTFHVFSGGTSVYSGLLIHDYDYSGIYRATIPVTGSVWNTGTYYNVTTSGMISGYPRQDSLSTFYVLKNTFDSFTGLLDNVYYADVSLCKNDLSGLDRYSVIWFKNENHFTGLIGPSFRVFTDTGQVHILQTGMSRSTGEFFDIAYINISGALRLASGERYVGEFYAGIDGVSGVWRVPLSKDLNT